MDNCNRIVRRSLSVRVVLNFYWTNIDCLAFIVLFIDATSQWSKSMSSLFDSFVRGNRSSGFFPRSLSLRSNGTKDYSEKGTVELSGSIFIKDFIDDSPLTSHRQGSTRQHTTYQLLYALGVVPLLLQSRPTYSRSTFEHTVNWHYASSLKRCSEADFHAHYHCAHNPWCTHTTYLFHNPIRVQFLYLSRTYKTSCNRSTFPSSRPFSLWSSLTQYTCLFLILFQCQSTAHALCQCHNPYLFTSIGHVLFPFPFPYVCPFHNHVPFLNHT